MNSESKKFLRDFLSQCGPSGFEEASQSVWAKRTKSYAQAIKRDVHGNVIAVLNAKADYKVMLAGHCDEIGFIISHITSEGFLCVVPVGGIDSGVLPSVMWPAGFVSAARRRAGRMNGAAPANAASLTKFRRVKERDEFMMLDARMFLTGVD